MIPGSNYCPQPVTLLLLFTLIVFSSCRYEAEKSGLQEEGLLTQPIGSQDWLTGNLEEKLETITNHLRGFDMAMVETGYRHVELYWAGRTKTGPTPSTRSKSCSLPLNVDSNAGRPGLNQLSSIWSSHFPKWKRP